mmetsp:Transcript_30548/g.46207  ORF Transcript_30548/g.46207 Transcript_30548/m.46207 type:complete len:214 (-) Transcript_30548:101-742(-)
MNICKSKIYRTTCHKVICRCLRSTKSDWLKFKLVLGRLKSPDVWLDYHRRCSVDTEFPRERVCISCSDAACDKISLHRVVKFIPCIQMEIIIGSIRFKIKGIARQQRLMGEYKTTTSRTISIDDEVTTDIVWIRITTSTGKRNGNVINSNIHPWFRTCDSQKRPDITTFKLISMHIENSFEFKPFTTSHSCARLQNEKFPPFNLICRVHMSKL